MGLSKLIFVFGVILLLARPFPLSAQTLPATLSVNAAATLTTFYPVSVFGSNVAFWTSKADYTNVQPKIQGAGNYFLRYPGGSSSDDYHWNGTGSFAVTSMGSYGVTYWAPDNTSYSPGFPDIETYRGTTSSYGTPSNITDGNNSTLWISNKDTDFPGHQWVELDFPAVVAVNAVTIVWGNAVSAIYPYPVSFVIQYAGVTGYPPPYQRSPETLWTDVSAGTVAGTGGVQGVVFSTVNSQYFRVLMTASSAGVSGAYSMAEARLYNGGAQVSSNSTTSTVQTQVEASSTDPASSKAGTWIPDFDFETYMAYLNTFSPPGIPMITVNFGTGTPQEAAAWVHYANKVRGYNIRLWQIGNETEGNWETGGPINTQDYVRRYVEYYDAMKAEDPTITITGPVAGGPYSSSNLFDGRTVIQDFIGFLHAQGKDGYVNAIDFHWYPYYYNFATQSPDPSAILGTPSQMAAFQADLNGWITGTGVNPDVRVLMSETNLVASTAGISDQLVNGLWFTQWLGEFIKAFGPRGSTNMWDTLESTQLTDPNQGGLSYLQAENNAYQYQERAHYWAMKMMTNYWASPGDAQTHSLVPTTGSTGILASYADYRPDGILSLMVVNNDPAYAYATTVTLGGFNPAAMAPAWTFNAANYQWQATGAPNHASPDLPPTAVTLTGVAPSFPVTFSPYSITVIQFNRSTVPTATPTVSPTPTLSPTITISPTPTATVENIGVIFPNPVRNGTSLSFYYHLDSACDQVKVKFFTTSFRKIFEQDGLPAAPGTHLVRLDWALSGLNPANGLYYVVLDWMKDGRDHLVAMKLFVLR